MKRKLFLCLPLALACVLCACEPLPVDLSYNIKNESNYTLSLHFDHIIGAHVMIDSVWEHVQTDSVLTIAPHQTIKLCLQEEYRNGEWGRHYESGKHVCYLNSYDGAPYNIKYTSMYQRLLGHECSLYKDSVLLVTWVDKIELRQSGIQIACMETMDTVSLYNKACWVTEKENPYPTNLAYGVGISAGGYANTFTLSHEYIYEIPE